MTRAEQQAIGSLSIALDRSAEVPLGVQLAWAIRARVRDGRLRPGQRLPGLRDLADALGVNFNTVRAVYQRLEQDGLVVTHHGSGTYVADTRRLPAVADIAASAARQAAETGVDPRDVAAALYMTTPGPEPRSDASAVRRRALRAQIAALEQALGELQAKHPQIAPPLTDGPPEVRPRLLSLRELERQRTSLVRALAAAQAEIDSLKRPPAEPKGPPQTAPSKRASQQASTSKRPARVRPSGRVAPAGT
jgi:DNA-binding transcriptional regulator YhcF (GntR family)